MIGADRAALMDAYGSPTQAPVLASAQERPERIVFVRPARLAPQGGLIRELSLCDRLGVAAGVEPINPVCEERVGWREQGESIPVQCILNFRLGPDRRVTAFEAEPAGCDSHLSPSPPPSPARR